MKRLCNKDERKILYKNRDMMLRGAFKKSSNNSFMLNVILYVAAGLLMLLGGIAYTWSIDNNGYHAEMEPALYIWILVSVFISYVLIRKAIKKATIEGKVSSFFNTEELYINGATIVGVNMRDEIISYIEDGLCDKNGDDVIVHVPACLLELQQAAIGGRIAVVYDSETSSQLMHVNEELSALIPTYSDNYPLKKEINSYRHVPHPNALRISFHAWCMGEDERELFLDTYVRIMQRKYRKYAWLGVICMLMGLGMEHGGGFYFGILIAVINLLLSLDKTGIRKKAKFQYVEQLIFHSFKVEGYLKQKTRKYIYYYQWNGSYYDLWEVRADKCECIPSKTNYGEIIYKVYNARGETEYIREKDLEESRKKSHDSEGRNNNI